MTNPDYSHTWNCLKCALDSMTYSQFLEHIRSIHGAGEKPQGNRTLLTHSDGVDWFGSSYRWVFDLDNELVEVTESIRQPRRKDDPLIWEADHGG